MKPFRELHSSLPGVMDLGRGKAPAGTEVGYNSVYITCSATWRRECGGAEDRGSGPYTLLGATGCLVTAGAVGGQGASRRRGDDSFHELIASGQW